MQQSVLGENDASGFPRLDTHTTWGRGGGGIVEFILVADFFTYCMHIYTSVYIYISVLSK